VGKNRAPEQREMAILRSESTLIIRTVILAATLALPQVMLPSASSALSAKKLSVGLGYFEARPDLSSIPERHVLSQEGYWADSKIGFLSLSLEYATHGDLPERDWGKGNSGVGMRVFYYYSADRVSYSNELRWLKTNDIRVDWLIWSPVLFFGPPPSETGLFSHIRFQFGMYLFSLHWLRAKGFEILPADLRGYGGIPTRESTIFGTGPGFEIAASVQPVDGFMLTFGALGLLGFDEGLLGFDRSAFRCFRISLTAPVTDSQDATKPL
jgi:hypothetical protein